MNIHHHPSDDTLAAYAAGMTDEATGLVSPPIWLCARFAGKPWLNSRRWAAR
jgi:anti-sigma factor ChrR (cupin superfamily)